MGMKWDEVTTEMTAEARTTARPGSTGLRQILIDLLVAGAALLALAGLFLVFRV